MEEEIFGPVLTIYVYEDDRLEDTLALCDTTSPYALTGSVFARDRAAIVRISDALRHAAGNFYVNDKPTGAVRRAAALRRRAGVGHERQGGQPHEPAAVDERPDDQGNHGPAVGLALSFHGRGVIGILGG